MADIPDLDRLVAGVVTGAATDEPLAQLAAAARVRDELDELTEALLDHFVEKARAAGCSWSQIGSVLGVSKQAAQQRHTTPTSIGRRLLQSLATRRKPMLGRFTPRARSAVARSEEAARALGHNYIGTEHLLLGILRERESIAARALVGMGVSDDAVESAVVDIIGRGSSAGGTRPFTPRAKKVMEGALREALALGHNYIGTEHMALALLALGEGVAADVLVNRGVGYEGLRQEIVRLLTGAA